jgi:hypothetical protein
MFNTLQFSSDNRTTAILTGAAIGVASGIMALLVVMLGPVMAFGAVLGLAAGLYILTNLYGGLYITLIVIALLPFGNLPFKLALTPTLLDGALGGFIVVYAMQWMTGQRRLFRSTPHLPIVIGFTGIMLFAFLLGLSNAPLTPRVLRNVAEMVMGLAVIPILVDVMRDVNVLRRAALVLMVCGAVSAFVGIVLWFIPDPTAESILNRLGRLGYPVGGVLRYRETSASILNERAIGTWVDPNAFGGFLLVMGAVIAPQIFSRKPVARRWLTIALLGLVGIALFLTDSRGSMISLAAACVYIAALRYRKLLWIMAVVVIMMLFLPFTQRYVEKFEAGIQGEDVETQMRFGEYKDAATLIGLYPVMGVGFSGVPKIDLYLGVANTYLTIASHAGIVGLIGYLILMLSPFIYSFRHYAAITSHEGITDIWLGLSAGLVGVMGGGIFDHFYFKIDQFQATMTLVWIIMGLMLASVRLAVEEDNSAGRFNG